MDETHKQNAIAFLNLVAGVKVHQAYEKYIGDDFRHHNPYFEGSSEALMKAMMEDAIHNPDKILEVKRVIGEGEFVAVHSHIRQNPDDPGWAVVHIFRFAGERIAEMWDVVQEIPLESPNQYGIF